VVSGSEIHSEPKSIMLRNFLLVGFGGMIGSMLRYLFAILIKPGAFPYATLAVNILGCLLIGVIIGLSAKNGYVDNHWKLFLATGICGGFTTFSAFSFECVQLMEQQRYAAMLGYIGLSVILGLAATFAGIQLAKL
jgi:fluoride exporter